MKLAIINYGSGNLHSVNKSFEAANQNLQEPYDIQVTNDPEVVKNADKIVLPGVGAFADCKKSIFEAFGNEVGVVLVVAFQKILLQKN